MINAKKKGTNAEYRCIKELKSQGYMCIRAAASKGIFDIWAIDRTCLRLIQVKSGIQGVYKAERELMESCSVPLFATIEIWHYKPREELRVQVHGPDGWFDCHPDGLPLLKHG